MNWKGLVAVSALLLAACSSASDPSSESPTDTSSDAVRKKCVQKEMCMKGDVWSSKKCRCVPEGPSCGAKTCGADEYCCSASCGICETVGAMCPAIACGK